MGLIFGSAVQRNQKYKPYQDRSRLYTYQIPWIKAANKGQIFVIADGLGSIEGSEIAADIAIRGCANYFNTKKTIKQILQETHREIVLKNSRIGTTIAGVIIEPDFNTKAFNMGDSRILQCKGREIIYRSEKQIMNGRLSSCLGAQEEFSGVYQEDFSFELGDQIAIYSDGALDDAVEEALKIFKGDPTAAAQEAVKQSRLLRSMDDITVIVLEREED